MRENVEVDDLGVEPQLEKITMEAGSCRRHVSGRRWLGQKGENQDPGWWIWQTNPQVGATKEELNSKLSLVREAMNINAIFSCYSLLNTIIFVVVAQLEPIS